MGNILVAVAGVFFALLTMLGSWRHRHFQPQGAQVPRKTSRHTHEPFLSIDYFAYASKMRHWSPVLKGILSLITVVLCIVLNNAYVSAIVIMAMAYLVIAVGGLSVRDYSSVLLIPLAFILLSVVAVVIDFSHQPMDAYQLFCGFGYLYTTPEMLQSGLQLLLKVLASISALQVMILTTPSLEIISVLRKTHLPAAFMDLMHMIYRYIFIFLDVFLQMQVSAASRLGYDGFRASCRTFGGVASNLFVVFLKKAGTYYDAMAARCYDGELLFLEEEKRIKGPQVVCAAIYFLYLLEVWYQTK